MSILGSKGKEPVASETVATYGTKRDLNGPSSILEATSQRLKNLNTIFSITSAKSDGGEKKSNTLTPSEEKETHQSSASTFGIPTTPKTTPFLTPNPLSPKNSQSDLTEVAGESQLTFEEMLIDKVEDHNMQADVPDIMEKSTTSKISRTLFQSQQPPTLSVERMTAGSKKFVVLDLLSPVLITDLIFPSCEYCNYITIDSWLQDENRESVRILSSDEISHKSIIVNSMNPPVLAQYIRITYTVNQFQKKTCRYVVKNK
jgi:hypothetical protein